MNEPEELRKIERDADALAAKMAADMLKHRWTRFIFGPVRKMMKWVSAQSRRQRREDGWL